MGCKKRKLVIDYPGWLFFLHHLLQDWRTGRWASVRWQILSFSVLFGREAAASTHTPHITVTPHIVLWSLLFRYFLAASMNPLFSCLGCYQGNSEGKVLKFWFSLIECVYMDTSIPVMRLILVLITFGRNMVIHIPIRDKY